MLSPNQREEYFRLRKGLPPTPASKCYQAAKKWQVVLPMYATVPLGEKPIWTAADARAALAAAVQAVGETGMVEAIDQLERQQPSSPPAALGNNGVVSINGEPRPHAFRARPFWD